jgi:uncharacterized membrane protein YkoI
MRRRTRWIAAGALALAIVGAGSGTGLDASGATDDEQPLAGSTLDRAVEAALAATGGWTVTETELGDDGAAYAVEIRLADGRQVEVNLDRDFRVTGQEADDDSGGE